MSISLDKNVERVGIVLSKRGFNKAPVMRVGVALDASGSAHHMFRSGVIQQAVDRLLAISVKFDDDGQLDVWAFDSSVKQLPTVTVQDETTYIAKVERQLDSLWGGTSYANPLRSAHSFWFSPSAATQVVQAASGLMSKMKSLFGKTEKVETPTVATPSNDMPAMLLFITDGENGDDAETMRVLQDIAKTSMYVQMVGVGGTRFTALKKYADQFNNVGYLSLSSLDVPEDQLYNDLITEKFAKWHSSLTSN